MKLKLKELNNEKKPNNKYIFVTTFYNTCLLCVALMLSQQTQAQTYNCSYDYPIQWDWIQEIIAGSDGCSAGEIQAIFYNDYIQILPGEAGSVPCPSDGGNRVYDCLGNFICEYGGDAPFATRCDQELIDIAMNDKETIWRYGADNPYPHNVIPIKGCPGEVIEYYVGLETPNGALCEPAGQHIDLDPITYQPIVRDVNQESACSISFTFEGEGNFIYSIQDPEDSSASLDCRFELTYKESCDPDSPCDTNNPRQIGWIRNLIDSNDGCGVGAILQFEYAGEVYFRVDPGRRQGSTLCPSQIPSKFYTCAGELVCEFGFLAFEDPVRCDTELIAEARNATIIWRNANSVRQEICPADDPLQWLWIRSLIENAGGCVVGSVQLIEGDWYTYISTSPGYSENGVPCPSDQTFIRYSCNGEVICESGGIIAPGNPRSCANQLFLPDNESAITIWTYGDELPTLACPASDPLQWAFVQDIINRNSGRDGCGVNSIQQFQYNGSTFIKTTPGVFTENGFYCPADLSTYYYNCEGTIVCETGAFAVTPPEDLCDADINTAANNATTIWTYENSPPTETCPEGDPLQWDWVKNLIDSTDGCFVAGIQQFEYDGNTFFKTTRGGIVNGVSCLDDITERYYDCNGNFICETGGVTPFERWCGSEIIAAANNSTNLWTYVDPTLNEPCPDGDPLQWNWMQALIASSDGCYFDEIRQFEYQGNTYYRTAHEVSQCLTENTYSYYSCKGEEVCQTIDLAAPGYPYTPCDQEIISASSNNYTVIWVFADTAPTLFQDYGWLGSWVNPNNCNGESITVYDAGSYNFILIQNGNEGKLYFENGSYYCDETPTYSCVAAYGLTNVSQTWTCGNSTIPINGCTDASAINYNSSATVDDDSCQYENTDAPLFSTYPWLSTYVNQNNCAGESITVYDAGSYNFILIQNGNEGKLYFENGSYYCDETPTYSCVEAYGLTNVTQTWSCGFIPPNPEPGCTDENAINYNPSATVDDGSCQYENTGTCDSYTGTFFYADCGGINYYFIRLADGRVFDPYFAEGIGITPGEGQQIRFDYVIKTDVTTPCTISESPITITCFEEISNTNNTPVFEDYPWLSTFVNSSNCNNESITVYDAGSYNFIYVINSMGNSLYYQDGTFYCQDAPGYSCVTAYRLSNVADNWTCGETNPNPDINPNPNPRECDVDNPITELDWLANMLYRQRIPPLSVIVSTYLYNNELIYAVDYSANDGYVTYYYCDGEQICNINPFSAINTCMDFNPSFVEVIYNYPNNTSPILEFTKYGWLAYFISFTECIWEPQVLEFDFGNYAFVYFKTAREGKLYLDDGTLYCEDTDGQTCLNNYNLSNPTNTWSCDGGVSKTVESSELDNYKFPSTEISSFNIYPNPTSNKVFIDLPDQSNYQINLLDIFGKIIKRTNTEIDVSIIELDVNDVPKGMYLVELKNELDSSIQKLIIE